MHVFFFFQKTGKRVLNSAACSSNAVSFFLLFFPIKVVHGLNLKKLQKSCSYWHSETKTQKTRLNIHLTHLSFTSFELMLMFFEKIKTIYRSRSRRKKQNKLLIAVNSRNILANFEKRKSYFQHAIEVPAKSIPKFWNQSSF